MAFDNRYNESEYNIAVKFLIYLINNSFKTTMNHYRKRGYYVEIHLYFI